MLNSCTFYILSDIITHICDYFEEEANINLHINMVKQTLTILNLGPVFANSLIKAIKIDKN